jgi:hypothetical protein
MVSTMIIIGIHPNGKKYVPSTSSANIKTKSRIDRVTIADPAADNANIKYINIFRDSQFSKTQKLNIPVRYPRRTNIGINTSRYPRIKRV